MVVRGEPESTSGRAFRFYSRTSQAGFQATLELAGEMSPLVFELSPRDGQEFHRAFGPDFPLVETIATASGFVVNSPQIDRDASLRIG